MPVKSTRSLTTLPTKAKSTINTRQKCKVTSDHEEFRLESWSASEVRELLQQTGISDSFNERSKYE